jgi:hypothetical protein
MLLIGPLIQVMLPWFDSRSGAPARQKALQPEPEESCS